MDTERPDIGKMIEEELAKGGAPETGGDRPLEIKAGSIVEGEPEKAAAPRAESPKAKEARRDMLEKDRKELAEEFGGLRKEAPPDEKERLAFEQDKRDFLKKLITLSAQSDTKISTDVLKAGIAVADEKTLHPYDAGLEALTDGILGSVDYAKRFEMLSQKQPDDVEAVKALMRLVQEKLPTLSKSIYQKAKQYGARPAETPKAAPAAEAAPRPMSEDEKRKAVSEAMKPALEDIAKWAAGDRKRKEREAAERGEDKKDTRSWWDKLRGKKAA